MKGPANLFTQALADLRLDGLRTLIAMTYYVRLGDLLVLLRYPEQLQGASREFNAQLETALFRKMGEYSIDYPRATLVEGDDRRYEGLMSTP